MSDSDAGEAAGPAEEADVSHRLPVSRHRAQGSRQDHILPGSAQQERRGGNDGLLGDIAGCQRSEAHNRRPLIYNSRLCDSVVVVLFTGIFGDSCVRRSVLCYVLFNSTTFNPEQVVSQPRRL